jgi:head-tail adaptor
MGASGVIARATTRISIYRGVNTEDEFGDVTETDTPVHEHVAMSLTEKTRFVATADQSQPMIVRYIAGRLGNGTDIKSGDRVFDERTGKWYAIDSMATPDNPYARMDIRLELKRVT